jgi:hypothetical protein
LVVLGGIDEEEVGGGEEGWIVDYHLGCRSYNKIYIKCYNLNYMLIMLYVLPNAICVSTPAANSAAVVDNLRGMTLVDAQLLVGDSFNFGGKAFL